MNRRRETPRSGTDGMRSRLLLLATGLLIVLGMSPILGHHLAGGLDRVLIGTDHLGALCVIALQRLLEPVHHLFHVLLAAGLAYAAWDRLQAARLLRRTLSAMDWRVPASGGVIGAAARDAGVDPIRIRIACGLPVPAFTAGWLQPRIYLAEELGTRLSPAELSAVIAHEAAHAARRDPLRLAALRFLGHLLFWIPVLRRLAQDCAEEAEIEADDAALRGQPLALASAILAVVEWRPAPGSSPGVGIHHPDLVSRRVRRLMGEPIPRRTHVTLRSTIGAATMLLVVWATGIVMVHPMPTGHQAHEHHCAHPGEGVFTHLLCTRAPATLAAGTCPHD